MQSSYLATSSTNSISTRSGHKGIKRQIRNRLYILLGIHVFWMLCFSSIMLAQILIEPKFQQFLSVLSICAFYGYFMLVLFSVKYKNKAMMIAAIVGLVLCAGLKIVICVESIVEHQKSNFVYAIDAVLILLNAFVPWRFFMEWNKLQQRHWRETFDPKFKHTGYLLDSQVTEEK